jgi:ABC-2 type transport system permease protein
VNRAIWKKAASDAWRQLLASCLLLILFSWVFVWLMSQIETKNWGMILRFLPRWFEPLLGFPLDAMFTRVGQLSILYWHVVTMLVCVGWALGRGSDSISGEIGRGTMDLLVSLPVWRLTILAAPAVIATLGAVLLVASLWAGTMLGVRCFMRGEVPLGAFLPGALNLLAMVFCFTGITTLISSWNRDRWRTIGWAGGFFVISMILETVARMWPAASWLGYFTFLAAFQPQRLIVMHSETAREALRYDLVLVMVGLAGYAAAAVIFWRRDIPAGR